MSLLGRAAKLLSRAFPNHVSVVSRTFEEYPLAPEARVALVLAQQDALAYGQIHATPERVLLAALENDLLVAGIESTTRARAEPIREALLLALARPGIALEARAVRASPRHEHMLAHALERSRRAARPSIGLGDVLAGIASTEGDASRIVGDLRLDYGTFDTSLVEPLPPVAGASDAAVAVFTLDDTVSKMEDVMRILEHGFLLPVRRAFHVMETTHLCGHGRVGRYPRALAEEHLARAKGHAAARGCAVRFHVGAVVAHDPRR